MKTKTILYNGAKSVDLWGDDLDGWTVLSGEGKTTADDNYYKFIPTLFRAVQSNANSVATMPFQLMDGKTVYDTSKDWKNRVGFMPNPTTLFALASMSLDLAGCCYLFRERNIAITKMLYYCLPDSIKVELDEEKHKIDYFERMTSNDGISVPKKYYFADGKPFDFIYFWPPDPYVEMGPALHYPAQAAANACGLLLNLDVFSTGFLARGAIKAMLLQVKGMPSKSDREELSSAWNRFVSGVKNTFRSFIINADAVTPVVVGEGLKELENVTIGKEKREDVAMALNIPMSILFANAANRATSTNDILSYLKYNTIPRCNFIQSVFDDQVFRPLGLNLHFLPESLDEMQDDETERSAAMSQFVKMVNDATSLDVLLAAFEIYGMEVSDAAMTMIKKAFAEKEKKSEEEKKKLAEEIAKAPKISKAELEKGQEPQAEQQPTENQEMKADTTFKDELDKWKRKAINAMKKGKPANVDFVTTCIPQDTYETIMNALGDCKSEDDVKGAFDVTQSPEPKFDSIMTLAMELKRANDILERTE